MGIKMGLPSAGFIINLVIALAIVALVLRMMPENVKTWFRW